MTYEEIVLKIVARLAELEELVTWTAEDAREYRFYNGELASLQKAYAPKKHITY